MSVVTYVLGRLGLLGISNWPSVHFKPELAVLLKAASRRTSKQWSSEFSANEYQRIEDAHRALTESYARLPIAK